MAHVYIPVREPRKAYALLSDSPSKDTAVVFVHGFDGDPVTTWRDFQTLIDRKEFAAFYENCDLYFYTYSNVGTLVPHNAQQCLTFIRRIFPEPQIELFGCDDIDRVLVSGGAISEAIRGSLPGRYRNLILVGHSIGGLLLRGAMWEAFRNSYDPSMVVPGQSLPNKELDQSILETDPVLGADLCLFAPAHLGISASGWLGWLVRLLSAISPVGPALVNALGLVMPAAASLQGQDALLSDIRRYTEEHSEKFPNVPALRARVLWGAGEWLVEAWQYKWDKPVEFEREVGHTSVCKPTLRYRRPLEFVRYGPKRQSAAR